MTESSLASATRMADAVDAGFCGQTSAGEMADMLRLHARAELSEATRSWRTWRLAARAESARLGVLEGAAAEKNSIRETMRPEETTKVIGLKRARTSMSAFI